MAGHGGHHYNNDACRCQECRIAHAEVTRQARQRRKARLEVDPSLAPHGRDNTYMNWMCRCGPCKAAHAQARRSRHVPSRGDQ